MDSNTRKKKSLWKKFRTLFEEVLLHRESDNVHEHADKHANDNETRTETEDSNTRPNSTEYVHASSDTSPQNTNNTSRASIPNLGLNLEVFGKFDTSVEEHDVNALFDAIEECATVSEKRVVLFVSNVSGRLRSWWNGLKCKPVTWYELKFILLEDLEGLKSFEYRRAYGYDSDFLRP